MPTSQEPLTVYLPPEVKEALQKWAEEEERSMSFLAAKAIIEAVKSRKKGKNG
ncbi:ribbon-helix-helix protein, CopG family [Oculatella sp. FACHB-28]|uniref:ribbon-helix-helix domain-containing protein n=1 Tax=Oculatella sp. FACHB-28 TaxID=2692845 RepID=UPI0016826B4F|nr:ribbon-helix-helix protein, CopG family [Oculatella sp. FACHB-28]MBD2054468.1 ribbon-helix-helix protein, CopG family [Oculatella sp. FACHB-28]